VSTAALAAAREGIYSKRSVRGIPAELSNHHLVQEGRVHRLGDELRSLVRFERHNLVTGESPPFGESRFDLVVCRNVLIYFERSTVRTLLGALERALSPGGALVIGAADRLSGPLGGSGARPHALRSSPALTRTSPVPRRGHRSRPSAPAPAPAVEAPADRPASKAVWATGAASLEEIAKQTGAVLDDDPLNVDAYFIKGVAQLAAGEPEGAVASLRRALYLQPEFGLAAFKLARAYEALHDTASARRAYRRALNSLRPDDPRQAVLLEQVDVGDIAMACRGRLAQLDDVR
jgi:chemotaxis protein methyltransferase CheR